MQAVHHAGPERLPVPEQTRYLMSTGRYPAWEFAFGLDCVLDGIGQRLGI
ncbi:hypothetical protein [Streptomyces luteogriseus]